jgi:nucleotide-binding universal stress UspA family protein
MADPEYVTDRFERILLASEGRPFSIATIDLVEELVDRDIGSVRVLSLARVHGVSFGMPHPGLLPTKKEWQEQRDIVAKAVARLKRRGIEADGHVVGTRKSTKRIYQEAKVTGCHAIVMGADRDRHRLVRDMFWEQEPQRVRSRSKRSKLPVYLVVDD